MTAECRQTAASASEQAETARAEGNRGFLIILQQVGG